MGFVGQRASEQQESEAIPRNSTRLHAETRYKVAMADDEELAAGLIRAELEHIHEEGIAEDVEQVTLPYLDELAQLSSKEQDDGSADYHFQQITALLRQAIGRMNTTQKRRQGMEALLDLTEDHEPRMGERRDLAAPFFGYKNGESLRQAQNRSVEPRILGEVRDALLGLAAEHRHARARKAVPSKPRPKPRPRTDRPTPSTPRKQRAAEARYVAGTDGILAWSERFPLTVDRRKGLLRMIEEGHYDLSDSQIRQLHFKASARGGQVTGRLLRCEPTLRDHAITDDMLRGMRRRRLRPASVEELLAFGVQYPDEQCTAPIVALGAQGKIGDGVTYIPYLLGSGSKRFLRLRRNSQRWPSGYRFLAVGR